MNKNLQTAISSAAACAFFVALCFGAWLFRAPDSGTVVSKDHSEECVIPRYDANLQMWFYDHYPESWTVSFEGVNGSGFTVRATVNVSEHEFASVKIGHPWPRTPMR